MSSKHRKPNVPDETRRISWVACIIRLHALREAERAVAENLKGLGPLPGTMGQAGHTGLPQRLWGLNWLRYACTCPVIDGWLSLQRSQPAVYDDPEIATLLESPMRELLYEVRDSVLHFTDVGDERVKAMLRERDEFVPWAENLQARFFALEIRTRAHP